MTDRGHQMELCAPVVADVLAEQLPDARRVRLPWAGHLPNLERPDEITALLLAELA